MNKIHNTTDELSRICIVNEIDENLFVEAGAGSGKTTMLVNRMVAMIESGIPVEKICAITFTKNAALEFYERFQRKLIERSNPLYKNKEIIRAGDLQNPNEETRTRCKVALENIDLCFMGTIDSFCNMILSEHPTEANIPSDSKLVDEEEINAIYKQFYIDIRNGKYTDELKKKSNLFNILFYNPEEIFATFISKLMDIRNNNIVLQGIPNSLPSFYKAFEKDRESLKRVLDVFNKDTSKLAISLKKDDDRDPSEVYKNVNETLQKGWQYNVPGVVSALKVLSTLTYKDTLENLGLTKELAVREADGIITLNVADKESDSALLPRINEYKYLVSMSFVLSCIPVLEKLLQETGKFTYFDYLYYLRNMLAKDSVNGGKLIKYISNRHSYFLIDEFQDTNPMQAEVFFYLAGEDPNNKKWNECVPRPGSLFIVGDPKQSIYRFRGADITSYLNIKNIFNGKNGKVLYLTNNFRSRDVLKNYFNTIFEELMPEETSNQSKYEDIENTNSDSTKELDGIYTYESYSGKLLINNEAMEDSERIANIIKKLVNNERYQVKDKINGDLRPITFSDFMVIYASKSNISNCIETFKKYNIPSRVEGKVLFENNVALYTIYNLYKTVTNTSDVISLVSTLYGPLFGFNDKSLAEYRANKKQIILSDNVEYGDSKLEKVLSKLNETSNKTKNLTPSSLFETIMDEYEVFRYVSADQLEVVYYTLELIRSEENTGNIVNYEDAIAYMEELLSGESGQERCLSLKQNSDAVHIANLHKVKGLEAPIVILGKSGTHGSDPEIRIENSNDGKNCYVISLQVTNDYTGARDKQIETNDFDDQAKAEKESLSKEIDRLIYVAATRARNVLIVNDPKVFNPKSDKPKGTGSRWKVLRQENSGDIFNVLSEEDCYNSVEKKHIDAEKLYEEVDNKKVTIESTYEKRSPSTLQTNSKLNEESFIEEGISENNDETYSTLIGTMVHRLMEMIVMSKDKLEKDYLVENIINEYVTQEFVSYVELFKEKLNYVYDVIHQGGFTQKTKVPQDILKIILSADEIYSEVPFTYKEDNIIWNGIIDLIYKKDNQLHIIDWKTNKNDDDLDTHYKSQLDAYIKATKIICRQEVADALIYHIDISK